MTTKNLNNSSDVMEHPVDLSVESINEEAANHGLFGERGEKYMMDSANIEELPGDDDDIDDDDDDDIDEDLDDDDVEIEVEEEVEIDEDFDDDEDLDVDEDLDEDEEDDL